MTDPSLPRLSRQFVVDALSRFALSPAEYLVGEEVIDKFMTWRAWLFHDLPIPEEDTGFWQRFRDISPRYSLLPWQGGNVRGRVEAFVEGEYQAFIEHIRQHKQVFCDLLVHEKLQLPGTVFDRLWELCFLPGVVIPFCTATARYWAHVQKVIVQEKKALNYQRNKGIPSILTNRWLSDMARLALEEEKEKLDRLLALMDEELQRAPIVAWKAQLGIDKGATIAQQKHRIWSIVFRELVDLLRPSCTGPKHLHLDTTPGAIPEQAFRVASRLMYLSHPKLWPDDPARVKSRYYAS